MPTLRITSLLVFAVTAFDSPPLKSIPTLVIGGSHSGVGKTSVAIGIMKALSEQGLIVQPFKVGPDFIDPGHHYRATGRVSHNLDGWMLTRSQNLNLFIQACQGADIAIVEGVMGLFDGYGAEAEAGSTAEMAKWLGAPVLLVINARALGRSAAAMIYGYTQFDPALTIAGVICNRIGGESHLARIRAAVQASLPTISSTLVIEGLPRSELVTIPERHLGLWMAMEDHLEATYINTLAQLVQEHIGIEQLMQLAQKSTVTSPERASLEIASSAIASPEMASPERANVASKEGDRHPQEPVNPFAHGPFPTISPRSVRIGIARDQAFCFYYAVNLALLEQAGAELVEFSPIQDSFPSNLDGLYLGGGYPELHQQKLADNQSMRQAIATFCQSGRPVYAECGGLMYLSQGIQNSDGQKYPFVGILPFWTRMGTKVKLGYRQVKVLGGAGFFGKGETVRGHRFHYSDIVDDAGNVLQTDEAILRKEWPCAIGPLNQPIRLQYRVTGWGDRQELEGYQIYNVLASYVHLHFGSNSAIAGQFVNGCHALMTKPFRQKSNP